jgi:hypothetical protein
MNPNEAARELRKNLEAPLWALSVSVLSENGKSSLIVRVDPAYRGPLKVPETFEGLPVVVKWRPPIIAQN